jgi:hypothetical protein
MARPYSGDRINLDLPQYDLSLDPEATDSQIISQGVRFVHYRSFGCPVGLTDPDDVLRRPHEHHQNCSNGFVYTKAGVIYAVFTGNSRQAEFREVGRYDDSTAQITVARYYDADACDPPSLVEMCQFDRLYLEEESVTVINWERFAAHPTGHDRLRFPVVSVMDMMDSRGNIYRSGTDFTVQQGQIVWNNGGPGIDPTTGKGTVCTARYRYRPFYYVDRMLHELRVANVDGVVIRMPQGAVIKRETHFKNEMVDPAVESPRQQTSPAVGLLGPR